MKKILSLILVFVLALGCCSALADDVITQRSKEVQVTIGTYVLTADLNENFVLWCADGSTAATISVSNGTGDRALDTTVVLQAGDVRQEVHVTDGKVKASDIAAFAKQVGGETVTVNLYTTKSTVTKNGISDTPTECELADTITVMNNPSDVDPVDEDDPDGEPSKFTYVVSKIDCPTTAYPGDIITVTGTTDKSKLDDLIKGTGYTATVVDTAIWVYDWKSAENSNPHVLKNDAAASVTDTYTVPAYMISFWTVSKVKVSK